MIKAAIEKIQEMCRGQVFDIDGEHYSDMKLQRIEPPEYRPSVLKLYSLDALIEILKEETSKISKNKDVFVNVITPTRIEVVTTYDDKATRDWLFSVDAKLPDLPLNYFHNKEEMIIALKSVFNPGDGVDYIINLLKKVTEESKVSTDDNGISQSVEAIKGIALKENIEIKNRVILAPLSTFLEVNQPESEFILRLKEGAQVLLKEADGGAWELTAKKNIKAYLEEKLCGVKGLYVIA